MIQTCDSAMAWLIIIGLTVLTFWCIYRSAAQDKQAEQDKSSQGSKEISFGFQVVIIQASVNWALNVGAKERRRYITFNQLAVEGHRNRKICSKYPQYHKFIDDNSQSQDGGCDQNKTDRTKRSGISLDTIEEKAEVSP